MNEVIFGACPSDTVFISYKRVQLQIVVPVCGLTSKGEMSILTGFVSRKSEMVPSIVITVASEPSEAMSQAARNRYSASFSKTSRSEVSARPASGGSSPSSLCGSSGESSVEE